MASIYKNTATKSAKGKVFAFGRDAALDGQSPKLGGYYVWVLCENYAGHCRNGVAKTWRVVASGLSYADAVSLMNRRLGEKVFNT